MYESKCVYTSGRTAGAHYGEKRFSDDSQDLVRVRPLFTGINGTLRSIVNGRLRESLHVKCPENEDFLVLGFECLGIVDTIPDRECQLRVGDYVVPIAIQGDDCFNCRSGRPDNCSTGKRKERGLIGMHGYMREIFYEHPHNLVKVEDRSIRETAVLTEPVKDVVKALEVFQVVSRRSMYSSPEGVYTNKLAFIIGSGSVAILYALMVKDLGFRTMISNRHELSAEAGKIVEDLGIEFYNAGGSVRELTGIDLLVDTAGDPTVLLSYVRRVNPNGVVLLFGTADNDSNGQITGVDITNLVERNISVVGSVDGAKCHYLKALDYVRKWNYYYGDSFRRIITGVYPPELSGIYWKKPPGELKSIIKWG